MFHTWIDERPLEEIIQTTVPNSHFDSEVEDILLRIDIDAHFGYKLYKNTHNSTLYDTDILILTNKIKDLNKMYSYEEEKFKKLCETYGELAIYDSENTGSYDQDGEGEEEEDEMDTSVDEMMVGQKDFTAGKKGPSKTKETTTKLTHKELQKILLQIKSIKAQMASSQQKLMDFHKQKDSLEQVLNTYNHYQYADRVYFSFMRKLIPLYEKNKDLEFLKKGVYCIVQYRDMMRKRYVSKDICKENDDQMCDTHYLPIIENNLCSLVV
jgi:hypothetical protein